MASANINKQELYLQEAALQVHPHGLSVLCPACFEQTQSVRLLHAGQ